MHFLKTSSLVRDYPFAFVTHTKAANVNVNVNIHHRRYKSQIKMSRHDVGAKEDSFSLPDHCEKNDPIAPPIHVNNHLFIFGYGNIGQTIAEIITTNAIANVNDTNHTSIPGIKFQSICGTVLTSETSSGSVSVATTMVEQIPIHDKLKIKSKLANATHVLITIPIQKVEQPPLSNNDSSDTRLKYEDVLLNEDNDYYTCIPPGSWVGYLSTTGVYGNYDGKWVDETSEIRVSKYTKAYGYHQAEHQWEYYAREKDWYLRIFRCSALYGNNLSALHTVLKQTNNRTTSESKSKSKSESKSKTVSNKNNGGEPKKSKEAFTSRIHMVDVSRAILASMAQTQNQNQNENEKTVEIYNLADNEPCSRSIVMNYVHDLLNECTTSTIDLMRNKISMSSPHTSKNSKPSERVQRRATESKRVSNSKMQNDLLKPFGGLLYPSFREGLDAILNNLSLDRDTDRNMMT